MLQAADPGAFLLLADQLHGPLSTSLSTSHAWLPLPIPQLDQHLGLPVDALRALAAGLCDLSLFDRATSVLIERGPPPEGAMGMGGGVLPHVCP